MTAQEHTPLRKTLSPYARAVTLATHLVLLAALAAWIGLRPSLILVLPLLLPLPGLWRSRPYTYAWNSLLVLLYLGALIGEASANPHVRTIALALSGLAAADFVSCLLYVRLRAAEHRAELAGRKAP